MKCYSISLVDATDEIFVIAEDTEAAIRNLRATQTATESVEDIDSIVYVGGAIPMYVKERS